MKIKGDLGDELRDTLTRFSIAQRRCLSGPMLYAIWPCREGAAVDLGARTKGALAAKRAAGAKLHNRLVA
jgi:hypothetical protein